MRRIVLLVTALLLCAPAAAQADFHDPSQACANQPGYAYVDLMYSDGSLFFKGGVYCDGATSAAITSLTLTFVVPPGPAVSGTTASCAPCDGTLLYGYGLTQASPGIVRVDMQFTATGRGGTYTPSRSQTYLWVDPIIQPQPIPPSLGGY